MPLHNPHFGSFLKAFFSLENSGDIIQATISYRGQRNISTTKIDRNGKNSEKEGKKLPLKGGAIMQSAYSAEIASAGQASAQAPQSVHFAASIT
jgi:hypothetical protein